MNEQLAALLQWIGLMDTPEDPAQQPNPNIQSAIARLRGEQPQPVQPKAKAAKGKASPMQRAILPARMQSPAGAERNPHATTFHEQLQGLMPTPTMDEITPEDIEFLRRMMGSFR